MPSEGLGKGRTHWDLHFVKSTPVLSGEQARAPEERMQVASQEVAGGEGSHVLDQAVDTELNGTDFDDGIS